MKITVLTLAFVLLFSIPATATLSDKDAAYIKAAAENGETWAQGHLGAMYHKGYGVKQNDAEALKWLQKAAQAGNTNSRYYLGRMYYKGDGVKQDYAEAYFWLLFSHFPGSDSPITTPEIEDIQRKLAVEKVKAVRNQVAERIDQTNAYFLRVLGVDCLIAEDYEEAYFWFSAAKKKGIKGRNSDDLLPQTVKHLTEKQLQAVKERVQKWQPPPPPDDAPAWTAGSTIQFP